MAILRLILALATSVAAAPSFAADKAAHGEQILRVGGDYTVEAIDKVSERAFKIIFKADKPSGKFDVLRLDSDHVHVAVKVGQKIRLSAEILSQKGPEAEVAQVVIFFEGDAGRVPVWMLSNKAPQGELRASKYLEMHVPANDFIVM